MNVNLRKLGKFWANKKPVIYKNVVKYWLHCDLGRIQTSNLLSRNQVHYSVMLRGLLLIAGANIFLFIIKPNNKV